MVCTLADIRFEMVSILYNIGALHSQLGASDSRVTAVGMKLSCTHFQCAAWAFQVFYFFEFLASLQTAITYSRFEVFIALKIEVRIFWVVTPCSIAVEYHYWYPTEAVNGITTQKTTT
jgi:hypothetical protein